MILLDTSTWIEYLASTKLGDEVRALLYQKIGVYTCPLTIAEISVWCHKNNEAPDRYLAKIRELSSMLEITEDILVASGRTYSEERKKGGKIGLVDCIIYDTARFHGLVLWTKDNDFKGLPGVEMLSEHVTASK
jgi:predicted nucleic acid-binding protein